MRSLSQAPRAFEKVWQIFQETDEKFQKTDEMFKELGIKLGGLSNNIGESVEDFLPLKL